MSSPTASLTVEPQVIQHGQKVVFEWVTTGADDVFLNGFSMEPSGEIRVWAEKSRTFHLVARNRFGTTRAEARVTMAEAMAATTQATPKLSKNAIAREFFDCGYDQLPDSRKTLIDARFEQLVASRSGPDRTTQEHKIPLCAAHAESWFCERNHLASQDCVVCAFASKAQEEAPRLSREWSEKMAQKEEGMSVEAGNPTLDEMWARVRKARAARPRCGKNMGNHLLVIPCDLPDDHEGPCERNVWPVTVEEQSGVVAEEEAGAPHE